MKQNIPTLEPQIRNTTSAQTGENQKGTGGRGRDRKCHKLSQIVVTFYDEFYDNYDVLCQWNKETEFVGHSAAPKILVRRSGSSPRLSCAHAIHCVSPGEVGRLSNAL